MTAAIERRQNRSASLLSRVTALRQTAPGRWVARCPAHEDRSPSLSIREMDDGRILIHCFSGCESGDVLAAVGLSFGSLFPEPLSPNLARVRVHFDPLQMLESTAHELMVMALIASDIGETGRLDHEQRDRIGAAAHRFNRALEVLDRNIPDEIRRIRRLQAKPA